jgi:small subunit ribosomal protein S16
MVVIRLSRGGSHKRPFYKIVVADQRCPRDGKFIEKIGYFNPIARGQDTVLNLAIDRAEHWINCGAQPSETVNNLIKKYKSGIELKPQISVTDSKKAAMDKQAKTEKPVQAEAEEPAETKTEKPVEAKAEKTAETEAKKTKE